MSESSKFGTWARSGRTSLRSADAKRGLALRLLGGDDDVADLREPRTLLAPRNERVDRCRGALEARFDPTVGHVAHRSAYARGARPRRARRSEAHALHPPFDDDS